MTKFYVGQCVDVKYHDGRVSQGTIHAIYGYMFLVWIDGMLDGFHEENVSPAIRRIDILYDILKE